VLASFNGADANGTWSLYAMDDANGDPGAVAGGWTLTITTVTPLTSVADLAVTITDEPDPVFAGSLLTYTITVTNRGPLGATGISVTDNLPLGLNYASSSTSQGSIGAAGQQVTANLGSLAAGASAVITVSAVTELSGSYTNTALVLATESDLNQVNNSASAISLVVAPQPARFSDVILTNGELQATLTGEPLMEYIVYASTDFVTWTPISTNTVAANGTAKFFDSNAVNFSHRFYRAVRQIP
jgi:uncharacterized repeat protein (TIGR01451 family)